MPLPCRPRRAEQNQIKSSAPGRDHAWCDRPPASVLPYMRTVEMLRSQQSAFSFSARVSGRGQNKTRSRAWPPKNRRSKVISCAMPATRTRGHPAPVCQLSARTRSPRQSAPLDLRVAPVSAVAKASLVQCYFVANPSPGRPSPRSWRPASPRALAKSMA